MTSMTSPNQPRGHGRRGHPRRHPPRRGARPASAGMLGDREFPATPAGYRALAGLAARRSARSTAVGVEGTGAYGAGLARYLAARASTVVEVDRPDRKTRRAQGQVRPHRRRRRRPRRPVRHGRPESRRRATAPSRRSARCAWPAAARSRPAPRPSTSSRRCSSPPRAELREQLRRPDPTRSSSPRCARLRPGAPTSPTPTRPPRPRCGAIARRYQQLDRRDHRRRPADSPPLVDDSRPDAARPARRRPRRRRPAARHRRRQPRPAHAPRPRSPTSAAPRPIPASSGRTDRHRLNRGGDRAANNALYTVVAQPPPLRPHAPAPTSNDAPKQGLTKKEIIRCLKRYVAREIYNALQPTPQVCRPTSRGLTVHRSILSDGASRSGARCGVLDQRRNPRRARHHYTGRP